MFKIFIIYIIMVFYFTIRIYLNFKSNDINKNFDDNRNKVFDSMFSYKDINGQLVRRDTTVSTNNIIKKQSKLKSLSVKISKIDQIFEMVGNIVFNLVSLALTINGMTAISFLCIPIIFNTINCLFIYWKPSVSHLFD